MLSFIKNAFSKSNNKSIQTAATISTSTGKSVDDVLVFKESVCKLCWEMPVEANDLLTEIKDHYGIRSISVDYVFECMCLFEYNLEIQMSVCHFVKLHPGSIKLSELISECGNALASFLYSSDYDVEDRCNFEEHGRSIQSDLRNLYLERSRNIQKTTGGLSRNEYIKLFVEKTIKDLNLEINQLSVITDIVRHHLSSHDYKMNMVS